MDDEVYEMEVNPHETRDRFVKLLVGTAAGFIASKVAETGVEILLARRRHVAS